MSFRQRAGSLVLALLAGTVSGSWAMADTVTETKTTVSSAGSDNDAIRGLLSGIARSATLGDAHGLSLLWSREGVYVDEDGVETRGRQSIESHLAEAFKQSDHAAIEMKPGDVKILGNDNAWVSGTTKRTTADGVENSRFIMLLHKADGKWQIESASELAVVGEKIPNQLHTLDWLLGSWSAERGQSKVKMTSEWVGNKSFIVCKYQIEEGGKPQKMEMQIVGWDPTKEQIVSWHFDSSGGFGYGTWINRDKQWVCLAEGVSDTGDRTVATNVITVKGKDQFTWQSINRRISGISVPDTEAILVQRSAQ